MILTQEELDKRINSEGNIAKIDVSSNVDVKKWQGSEGGRTVNTPNLTGEQRVAIGVIGETMGVQLAADTFGVSIGTVSRITNDDKESHADEQKEIKSRVAALDEKIAEKAADKLLSALDFLSEEKLANASAKDASAIAANLSKVSLNMRTTHAGRDSSGPKVMIILNQPKPAIESHFDTIEVSN